MSGQLTCFIVNKENTIICRGWDRNAQLRQIYPPKIWALLEITASFLEAESQVAF